MEEEEFEKNEKEKASKNLYTQEEVTEEISRDLIHFKDYINEEEGNKPSDYGWEIVDSIYREHGNSVAEMIQGFIYTNILLIILALILLIIKML